MTQVQGSNLLDVLKKKMRQTKEEMERYKEESEDMARKLQVEITRREEVSCVSEENISVRTKSAGSYLLQPDKLIIFNEKCLVCFLQWCEWNRLSAVQVYQVPGSESSLIVINPPPDTSLSRVVSTTSQPVSSTFLQLTPRVEFVQLKLSNKKWSGNTGFDFKIFVWSNKEFWFNQRYLGWSFSALLLQIR